MMSAVGPRDRVEAVFRSSHTRLWRSLLLYTADAELASDAAAWIAEYRRDPIAVVKLATASRTLSDFADAFRITRHDDR